MSEQRPVQRLIDANALIKHKYYDANRHEYSVPVYNVDTAPTIDTVKSEWINNGHTERDCSQCGKPTWERTLPNFCPNCGADMRK